MGLRELPLEKHRDAEEYYIFDFSDERYLPPGVTLTGSATVTVARPSGGNWASVSSQVVDGAAELVAINGEAAHGVRVKLRKQQAPNEQLEGVYAIACACATSDGRTVHQVLDLIISAKGSVPAS